MNTRTHDWRPQSRKQLGKYFGFHKVLLELFFLKQDREVVVELFFMILELRLKGKIS